MLPGLSTHRGATIPTPVRNVALHRSPPRMGGNAWVRHIRRQGGEKIAGGFGFPHGPFDEQPFFATGSMAPLVTHPHARKTRAH